MPRQKSWIVPVALEPHSPCGFLDQPDPMFHFSSPGLSRVLLHPPFFALYHRLFNHKDHDIIIIIIIILVQFTNSALNDIEKRVKKINYPLYLLRYFAHSIWKSLLDDHWERTTEIERSTTIVFTVLCTCDSDQIRDWNEDRHASSREMYLHTGLLCSADVSRRKARRQMEVDRTTAVSKNLALNGGEKKVIDHFPFRPESTPPPPPPPHHPTTFLHSACYTLPLPWCTGTSKASPPATSRLVPLTDW